MTPPITNFKTNQPSSNSSSPQQQGSPFSQPPPQSQPPPMQYGAIYQQAGNIQPIYHQGYHQPGYMAAASNQVANESHQQIHNDNVPISQIQTNIPRGGSRSSGGLNRRGGRNRGAGTNVNNGNMNPRRQNEYRQNNNNQQSNHQNSMNSSEYNLMDHHQTVLNSSPYQPVIYYQYSLPGSAIPTTAQNLTGQPLFALQHQQPYFIQPYGHPYPVVYNYMPPQMPPIQSDVIDSDQNQDVNAPPPTAVYQAIPPYHLAYQPEHHFELCDPPLPNEDRIEFQGSMPEEEYPMQMMSNAAENFVVEHNEVPIVENHDIPLDYPENEIQSDNQSIVYDHKDLIEKTRDLIIQTSPAIMQESPNQFLDDTIIMNDDSSTTLQFTSDENDDINLIEQQHQQQQVQQPQPPLQQQPQIVHIRKTNFVPTTSSNPITIAKKQTASVSVSAIPNQHFEEIKTNEYVNEQHHQVYEHLPQQQVNENSQNQNTHKNSFSSITKHSPRSLKDEKKTEIIKQNDSQKTSLSEQAKQQIASTISNSDTSLSSVSSATSTKKDKMETAGPSIIANANTSDKDSKTVSSSPNSLDKSAQNAKQTNNSVPHSWAGLFHPETSNSRTISSPALNQIKRTTSTELSNSTNSAIQSNNLNNKLPGTMSYSAVSAQSVAIQSTSIPPQSANKSKPNTASIATSTSSNSNNNEASNSVYAPKPISVDQNALKLGGKC